MFIYRVCTLFCRCGAPGRVGLEVEERPGGTREEETDDVVSRELASLRWNMECFGLEWVAGGRV
jgi:hypothetical protein